MFQSTLPSHSAELKHVSEFEQDTSPAAAPTDAQAGSTRLSALNPSLVQDLQRFESAQRPGGGLDALEVLAAALRHGRALRVHLELEYRVIPLTVRPLEQRLECPLQLPQLLELRLPDLRVLRVEPAPLFADPPVAADAGGATPLAVLLWELALRGSHGTLLPEIAGAAAYRVPPGGDLQALGIGGSLAAAVNRLRRQITPLREIASWPGFDLERATRLLNGLYLQSALMVSRTHPAALSAD